MTTPAEMTEEQAKAFHASGQWRDMTAIDRAKLQMIAERLCMPFSVFHQSISEALGRDVLSHEFGPNWDGLKKELFDGAPAPTLDEVLAMLPAGKPVIVITP